MYCTSRDIYTTLSVRQGTGRAQEKHNEAGNGGNTKVAKKSDEKASKTSASKTSQRKKSRTQKKNPAKNETAGASEG